VFSLSEAEAATIRTAFEQDGELSAAIELRRLSRVSRMVQGHGSAQGRWPLSRPYIKALKSTN
jgi:hypothetical protein